MILVKIFNGLGNQMFQYAAARRLAERHQTDLKLDLSWFENNQERTYGLNCFSIEEQIATREQIEAY